MFPDDWDWSRIQQEVEHAVKYNEGQAFPDDPQRRNIFKGRSIDGKTQIQFYLSGVGNLTTYHPIL